MTLADLLTDIQVEQNVIRKAFMPFTRPIEVDGYEKSAVAILLNLSTPKITCDNWSDTNQARGYFANQSNIENAIKEIKWLNSHNLKYPDARVKECCIFTPSKYSSSNNSLLGWSHDAAKYRHTIWLINSFSWCGKETSLYALICEKNAFWLALLEEFGLTRINANSIYSALINQTQSPIFPNEVNSFSKQVVFPYENDYLSITPVVSTVFQVELEQAAQTKNEALSFARLGLPKPMNIGNLCASLGGHMNLLYYPVKSYKNPKHTLLGSRLNTGKYFDDSAFLGKRFRNTVERLTGSQPLTTQKKQALARKYQIRYFRNQIAHWLLPLIELRDSVDSDVNQNTEQYEEKWLVDFLSLQPIDFQSLKKDFSSQIHLTFQKYNSTKKFAYHPKLLDIIDRQIKVILKWLSRPLEEGVPSYGDEQYIHLSSMRVFDLNAMSCPYLVGAPSLSGVFGFVHNFERKLKDLSIIGGDANLTSFALYIRDENIIKTAKLAEPCELEHTKRISKVKLPNTLMEYYSDIEFDLVIRVESVEPITLDAQDLKACVPNNFVGGTLLPPLLEHNFEWLKVTSDKSSLFHSIKSLPRSGSWLFPTEKHIFDISSIEKYLVQDDSLIPVANGFHFLEVPRKRKGSSKKHHVYAENALLMAKKVNPITLRFLSNRKFFTEAFWQLEETDRSLKILEYKG